MGIQLVSRSIKKRAREVCGSIREVFDDEKGSAEDPAGFQRSLREFL